MSDSDNPEKDMDCKPRKWMVHTKTDLIHLAVDLGIVRLSDTGHLP